MRILFWIHRWTGIVLGLMTLVWFVSGMVVHWYAFVDASDTQLLGGYGSPLTPSELHGLGLPNGAQVGHPMRRSVLRHSGGGDDLVWETETQEPGAILTDARSGERRSGVTIAEATAIAERLVRGSTSAAQVSLIAEPDAYYYEQSFRYEFSDQGSLPFPAYRVSFAGPPRVAVYVDSATGRVAAVVGPRQRFTRLFGTMPHFLNPRLLHGHATLHLVIMVTLLLGALVSGVSGLLYGTWFLWRQGRARASGNRARPLRRLIADWHNWIGVTAGAFVVTWAISGCLMLWYPEVTPDRAEIDPLEAGTIQAGDYRVSPESALRVVSARMTTPVAALQARRLLTRPVYDARHVDGRSTLIDGLSGGILSPLSDSLVRAVVRAYLGDRAIVKSSVYSDHYDAYYYNLHGRLRPLPVYRVDLADPRNVPSPLYIDALRGELVGRVNSQYRTFRWFGSALHTMDFPVLFFHQTMWHVVLGGLALLGALLSGSGLWIGFSHVARLARGSSASA